jgi:uncharacterized protein
MKIDISSLLKADNASLDVEFNETLEELNEATDGFEFNDAVNFIGTLAKIGGIIKLQGKLKTTYAVKCYRCLKDISGNLDINVKENFVNSENNSDSEIYTYVGNNLEINTALRDNIILNLPMKQVCSEDCKGLCPNCGTDLNVGTCECKGNDINPKMEALKNFFNN